MQITKNLFLVLLSIWISLPAVANTPDLLLMDLEGKQHRLNEYVGKGQWTVVVLWAEDCEICNAEIEALDFFHDEHKNKNARVLGVTIDGADKIALSRDFVKRHGLSFPNLVIEPDMAQISKFGGGDFIGTPTFYIYTPEGQIVASQAGAVPNDVLEKFIADYEKNSR